MRHLVATWLVFVLGISAGVAEDAGEAGSTENITREAAWLERNFPGADITDLDAFYRIQSEVRKAYPRPLRGKHRQAYAEKLKSLEALQEQRVKERAIRDKVPFRGKRKDGRAYQLIGFQKDRPIYSEPENAAAAISTAASNVHNRTPSQQVLNPVFPTSTGRTCRIEGTTNLCTDPLTN